MKASIGMRLLFAILLASSLNGLAFGQSTADDLLNLGDEFDNPTTLTQWQRVFSTEQWGADQLQLLDINNNRPGRLVMMPFSSTWYNDYRGELFFKTIHGDLPASTLPADRAP